MQTFLIFVSLIILISIIAVLEKKYKFIGPLIQKLQEQEQEEEISYRKNKYFLTDSEKNFFFILKPIADRHNLVLFPKVRLLDLFFVPKQDQSKRSRIIQKHVDFVLCESKNIDPVCAIELDDYSHNYESRQKRDDFVEKVFSSAGLPLVRIKTAYKYSPEEIEKKILESINNHQ